MKDLNAALIDRLCAGFETPRKELLPAKETAGTYSGGRVTAQGMPKLEEKGTSRKQEM